MNEHTCGLKHLYAVPFPIRGKNSVTFSIIWCGNCGRLILNNKGLPITLKDSEEEKDQYFEEAIREIQAEVMTQYEK